MAEMEDAIETELSTDFAILVAAQEGVLEIPGASFAGSTPGFISLEAGSKYSRMSVRVERWNARPPELGSWEDLDDIPFEEVADAGSLVISGFDLGEVGLDVSGFGRGRVQVFARGRHRYSYSSDSDVESMEPEEWLLRLYPSDGAPDPMAGGPRRIAGGLSRSVETPWLAAVRGYDSSGWSAALLGSHGFSLARRALFSTDGPRTRLEFAQRMVQGMPPWEVGGADAEKRKVPLRASVKEVVDPLELSSGVAPLDTVGDSIDALLATGLLLIEHRDGERLLVPNPSPQPAWERLELSGKELVWARTRALENGHVDIASNISFAVGWSGSKGLSASPRQMAIRWSTSIKDVVGGLRLLGGSSRVTADREFGFDTEVGDDDVVTMWRGTAFVTHR